MSAGPGKPTLDQLQIFLSVVDVAIRQRGAKTRPGDIGHQPDCGLLLSGCDLHYRIEELFDVPSLGGLAVLHAPSLCADLQMRHLHYRTALTSGRLPANSS